MFSRIKPVPWLPFFVLLSMLLSLDPLRAQILEFDQNPPHIQWRQNHTENFRLIYPAGFESQALLLSQQIDHLSRLAATGLRAPLRKTPIILQTQSVLSNGFVQLAPRRSEFVTTPPRQGETRDWMGQLTIHELRHIAQFDLLVGNFRRPFLEQAGLAFFGLHLPSWFFEGDAVWVETHLARGGRGTVPSWNMPLRANLLSGKQYRYQKNYLGSYKDVTPDFYALGYFMVEKLYREHGAETSGSLIRNVSRNLLRPYAFSRAVKKQSGYTTGQWHQITTDELRHSWEKQEQAAGREFLEYPQYPVTDDRFPSDWLLPQIGSNGAVMVLHRGAQVTPEILELDPTGTKHQIVVKTGWQADPHFSVADSRIVWDELRRNPRYAKQIFSVINAHDRKTGKTRQLSHRSRLFSPALSPDGERIACIEVSENNEVAILMLDWHSGAELSRFPVSDGLMLQTPAFDPSGNRLVAVAVSEEGTSLVELDLPSARFTQLIAWQDQQLERPVYWDRFILFKAPFDGIDNIYSLERAEDTLLVRQLTRARFGAFSPSVDSKTGTMLFNHYVAQGYRVGRVDSLHQLLSDKNTPDIGPVLQIPSGKNLFALASMSPGPFDDQRTSAPYYDTHHLFNFHSLSVTQGDFSSLEGFNPGIYLLSDNLLNTLQSRVGYVYDGDRQTSEYHASLTYQRFLPKLSISYQNRARLSATDITSSDDATTSGITTQPAQALLRWRENHLSMNMSFPLVFYKYNQIYSANFSVGTYITNRYGLSASDPKVMTDNHFVQNIRFPMAYAISFGRSTRRSLLDLAPRWGQHFSLRYRHFTARHLNKGETSQHMALSSLFYFPGIFRHHSLVVRASYQKSSGTYNGAYDIHMISGFDQIINQLAPQSKPLTVNNTLLTAYRLPLAYPDLEIGGMAYIKRLKGGLFADFQNLNSKNQRSLQPLILGIEMRADMHFLRFPLPLFDVGAKLIHVRDKSIPDRWLVSYGFSYSY